MKTIAVKKIKRANISDISILEKIGVATSHESQNRKGLMDPHIRPIYKDSRIAGSAVTVLTHPNDNWMIHVAIELCLPGDILVVGTTDESTYGMFGDLLATLSIARGIKGLVIDAGIRDVKELTQMGFPVWSRVISAQGTVKERVGSANIPIICGGQRVEPGDVVIADDDGVCIVSRKDASQVAKKAHKRVDQENKKRERFKNGELSIDLYNMRDRLKDSGLVYVESQDEMSDDE